MLHKATLSSAQIAVRLAAWVFVLIFGSRYSRAADPQDEARVQYNVTQISATGGGVYVYVSDKWGMLHLRLVNPQDREIEVLCVTAFEQEKTLQFGRRVWLPPRSRTETWHPIKLPRLPKAEMKTIDYRTSVMEAGAGEETLIRDESGKMQLTGTLRVSEPRGFTGLIGPRSFEGIADERRHSETFQMIIAARAAEGLPLQISQLNEFLLPPGSELLEAVDQLVLSDGLIRHDGAALSAIRRWLYGGGRLWVLLDQVDPVVMELLLGDEWACQVVDRVGLTTVAFRSELPGMLHANSVRDFEEPVDLVRTIVQNADVLSTVNGWPAAFTKSCGAGRLLVTTLGPRGWFRKRGPSDPKLDPRLGPTTHVHVPIDELTIATSDFFSAPAPPVVAAARLEPQVQDYVGYSIPPRGLVIGLLGGFSVLLAAFGIRLSGRGRLERLGGYGPLLAGVVGAILLGVGHQQRRSVERTVAQVQVVEPIPGTDDVQVRGVAGLLSPDQGKSTVEGTGGGWLMPDLSGSGGTTRRLIWSDLDRWRWENLPESPGLRSGTFSAATERPDRTAATATFGPQGLTGKLTLPGNLVVEDLVLATREGRVGAIVDDAGNYSAASDQVLGRDQYVSAALLTDEQRRRSQTIRQMLTDEKRPDYPEQPCLLFWTSPWNLGFDFGRETHAIGSALVVLPVRFERPETGTVVTILPPLLPYRGAHGPDGTQPTGLYDFRKREWVEKTGHTSTWIRFQVPPILLPMEPLSARLVVRVDGPVGKLSITGWDEGREAPVQTWMDPVGTLSKEITDPKALKLTANGGLFLRVYGGDPDRPELTMAESDQGKRPLYWRIESLTLELRGRVESTEDSNSPASSDTGRKSQAP